MNLFLSIVFFAFTWWLGLYLLQRHSTEPRLGWTGAGLMAYAVGMADLLVFAQMATSTTPLLPLQLWWLLSLPALFWTGTALHLLPVAQPLQPHLLRFWQYGQLPLLALLAPLFFAAAPNSTMSFVLQLLLIIAVLLPLGIVVLLLLYSTVTATPRHFSALLLVAALLFLLSTAALLLPILPIPLHWGILAMGFDLALLGFAIGKGDAFEQGENFLPDLLLALGSAAIPALVFGGLVTLTMLLATGVTTPMLILLLTTISAAIALQTFAPTLQRRLDHLVLAPTPRVIEERAELRSLAAALPRQVSAPPTEPPLLAASRQDALDEDAFIRFTRRALSQLNDLNKLATNPLSSLPIIEQRLWTRNVSDNTLERAQELRTLLIEAINQLKPTVDTTFQPGSAWRHYNALYFPYVIGLKPYSRRTYDVPLDPTAQQALDWLRTQVPERTLYNWQTAAATLVAHYLREINGQSLDKLIETPPQSIQSP